MPHQGRPFEHFDPAAMVEDFMNSPEVAQIVLSQFISWQETTCAELRNAIATMDNRRIGTLAHSLRGTLAQLHATAGSGFASAIETRCQQNLAVPEDLLDCLFSELDAITREVQGYLASTSM